MADEFFGNQTELEPREPQKAPGASPKVNSVVRTIIEFGIALLVALALTWALKTYVVEPFEVPTGSMEPTIMVGDKILTEKVSLNFEPVVKGDIIVFADKTQPGRILVKRVIAVGGQQVDFQEGLVLVDGEPLYEPETVGESYPLASHFENMAIDYPYTVPEGQVWVMGDNRESSQDSRYFGSITEESIYGRVWMVFWPLEDIKPL